MARTIDVPPDLHPINLTNCQSDCSFRQLLRNDKIYQNISSVHRLIGCGIMLCTW